MVKLTSRLNTIPSFSRLLDKIEKAYKQDNEGDYQVYALAFFDRLFNQYQIDAVDVSEADVYAFPTMMTGLNVYSTTRKQDFSNCARKPTTW